MAFQDSSEKIAEDNKQSLSKLARAITLSQNQFSLILVRCNSEELREQMIKKLHKMSPVEIKEFALPRSATTLYTTLLNTLENQQPQALMVYGLESVTAINQLLTSTNLVRDEFRKKFSFPLVLWMTDEILHKLMRLAPDFKNWATTPIRFETAKSQLIGQGTGSSSTNNTTNGLFRYVGETSSLLPSPANHNVSSQGSNRVSGVATN